MGGEDVAIEAAGGMADRPARWAPTRWSSWRRCSARASPDGRARAHGPRQRADERRDGASRWRATTCGSCSPRRRSSRARSRRPRRPGSARASTRSRRRRAGRCGRRPSSSARRPRAAAPDAAGAAGAGGGLGEGADVEELRVVVGNRLGLHARPAARFVGAAAGADAQLEVSNATTGRGPVSARSLTALATLGVRQGHEILVQRARPRGRRALDAIQALADDNFGDDDGEAPAEAADGAAAAAPSPAARRRPRPATRCAACPSPPASRSGPPSACASPSR